MSAAACLRPIVPVLALGLSFANAQAVELNQQAVIYQLPDQINWKDTGRGAKNAVLNATIAEITPLSGPQE